MAESTITQYELSRQIFDWSFENPDLIKPIHIAIYFFAIEHCNRLGWKEKFGLPTSMVMEAIGVKSYKTYKVSFDELADWGFFKVVKKATNQYSAVIIALVKNTKAHTKALDKALIKHSTKHTPNHCSITDNLNVSIDKQYNNKQYNKEQGEKPKGFHPPTEIEVVEFFEEKGFAKDLAQKAFEYYNIADWKDSKGNKVKNWKQKMLSVWMKNNNTTNHATAHNTEPNPADSEKIGRVSISDLKKFAERRSVPTQSGAA